MEPPAETGPDNFEIQIISDDVHNSKNAPESVDVLESVENKVDSAENIAASAGDSDLLRTSLSDVVLSQSLQFTEKSIDFEDGDKSTGEGFVEKFDSVLFDDSVPHENSVGFPEKNELHTEEVRVNVELLC